MQLNEIIDKEGIDKVSSKTNISVVGLQQLVDEKFEKLGRVKSLGFLLILEREYNANVDELRQKVKAYFEEHQPVDEKVLVISQDVYRKNDVPFFKIFVLLALFSGGWYFYSEGKLDGLVQQIESQQNFFDDNKALDSNTSDENANKITVENDTEESSVSIENVVMEGEGDEEENDGDNGVEKNGSVAVKSEENVTKLELPNSTITIHSVDSNGLATAEVASGVNPTDINSSSESNASATIETVSINPTRGMLWFGFINMDTKKHHEFMSRTSKPFDIKGGQWLLVTGHGYVDIVSEAKTVELADNKKHFFYIDNKEIKEVSREEFRSMNGNKGW